MLWSMTFGMVVAPRKALLVPYTDIMNSFKNAWKQGFRARRSSSNQSSVDDPTEDVEPSRTTWIINFAYFAYFVIVFFAYYADFIFFLFFLLLQCFPRLPREIAIWLPCKIEVVTLRLLTLDGNNGVKSQIKRFFFFQKLKFYLLVWKKKKKNDLRRLDL